MQKHLTLIAKILYASLTYLLLFVACNISTAFADLSNLQNKYEGFELNGNTISKDEIKNIYIRIAQNHPFEALDRIIRSPDILDTLGGNCEKQTFSKYQYACDMGDGFLYLRVSKTRVIEYQAERDMKDIVNQIINVMKGEEINQKKINILYSMMWDLVLQRFNDLSPKHIIYSRNGTIVTVQGMVKD